MSNQLKAENMRFLLMFCPKLLTNCCCGISLKKGYIIGIFILFFLEVLYYAFGCSHYEYYELVFIGLIIWSFVKAAVLFAAAYCVKQAKFEHCYLSYILLTLFTYIHIISSFLSILLYIFEMKLLMRCMVPKLLLHTGSVRICVVSSYLLFSNFLYMCINYLGYSYTKRIGLEMTIDASQEYVPPRDIIILNTTSLMSSQGSSQEKSQENTLRKSSETFKTGNSGVSGNSATSYKLNKSFYQDKLRYPAAIERYTLKFESDIEFAKNAQNSIVNESVMPSGLRIPGGRNGKNWRIFGFEVILV
jgi:hypothetical protein